MPTVALIVAIVLLALTIYVLIIIAQRLDEKKQRRLTGIIAFLLCAIFFVSQVSFLLYPNERYKNLGGLFGYYSSLWLFYLIGFYFFILPALLWYLGFLYSFKQEKKDGYHLLYFIPIGIIADTIIALFFENLNFANCWASGIVGKVIKEFLIRYFGIWGTYIIILFGILIILFMSLKRLIIPASKKVEIETKKEKRRKNRKDTS